MIRFFALRAGRLLLGIGLVVILTSAGATNVIPVASHHPGGASTSTLKVVMLDSTDGLPHYGQSITFNVSTTVTTTPYVKLDCYQNQVWVNDQWAGFFPDFPWTYMQTFPLTNSLWTGGEADCTATLYYYSGKGTRNITSLDFHVYA
jgi:hypothetical protein